MNKLLASLFHKPITERKTGESETETSSRAEMSESDPATERSMERAVLAEKPHKKQTVSKRGTGKIFEGEECIC